MEVEQVGKGRLPELFESLKIARVVFVDDMSLSEPDGGAIQAAIVRNPEAADSLGGMFLGVELSLDNSALVEQADAVIARMNDSEREGLRHRLNSYAPATSEMQDLLYLQGLVPDNVPLSILNPARWAEERARHVAACSSESRTLFFFDQELNGDRERDGFVTGTDIIRELSASDPEGFGTRWYCGLLSNRLIQGTEIETWQSLSEDHNVALKFFMPIAKGNLQDKASFFGAVYRTVINTYCETMKEIAAAGFKDALAGALKKFHALDPIDFEHMIVGTSEKEGVSELDTLVRLYGIMHKDEVRSNLLQRDRFARFSDAAAAVKTVADIDRKLPAETQERLNRLRFAELYDDADLVNRLHEPLGNGDLFQVNGVPYVLLAQPCDLMVRSSGERGRERNFKIAFIAEISEIGEKAFSSDLQFSLYNFYPDGTRNMKVDFFTATSANLQVLDLTVLREDGSCWIDPATLREEDLRFPSRSWERRTGKLSRYFNRTRNKIEDARTQHGDEVAALLATEGLPKVAQADALRKLGSYEKGKFSYPIRRIGRVRQPLATSLLSAFGRYLARDAYDHDFARPLPMT